MPKPQGGLGRGLSALIPPAPTSNKGDGPTPSPTSKHDGGDAGHHERLSYDSRYVELPLDALVENQFQPRKVFDDQALESLASSIRQFGVLQPVVVRKKSDNQTYELIAGERRWRASKLAGRATVPAIIRTSRDELSLVEALVENLHREDLNPIEEAAGFRQLIDDFDVTHAEVARRLGKGRATISNSLRLMELPLEAQTAVAAGKISAGHARALLACASPSRQAALLRKIIDDGLSVRAAENFAKESGSGTRTAIVAPEGQSYASEPSVLEAQNRLSDHLNTTVSVHMGAKRGKITIEFATISDLTRIYEIICRNNEGS